MRFMYFLAEQPHSTVQMSATIVYLRAGLTSHTDVSYEAYTNNNTGVV